MAEDKEARIWRRLQEVLGYSDAELTTFKANPKFVQMMNTPAFRTHTIVAEVVSSRGCLCQHLVGQRIVLTGNGALLRDECPSIMCLGLIAQLSPVVSAVWERFAAGLDPNGILIDTIGCSDVGVECGGWGRVIAKVRVEGPVQP